MFDFNPMKLTRRNAAVAGLLAFATIGSLAAQDRYDRDRDRDGDRDRSPVTRLQPGTVIAVRTNQGIDSNRYDTRVYSGIVDNDVRGDNGGLAIPRGSRVELIVRTARDNDLNLDLESVMVNGQRYAVRADPSHIEARRDDSLVGSIVGAINGAQGREIHIPRDTVLTFRLQVPLDMGVVDRGVDRDGYHYHDWYRQDR